MTPSPTIFDPATNGRRPGETPTVTLIEPLRASASADARAPLDALAGLLQGRTAPASTATPLAAARDALADLLALPCSSAAQRSNGALVTLAAAVEALRHATTTSDDGKRAGLLGHVRDFCDRRLAPQAALDPDRLACRLLRRFALVAARLGTLPRITAAARLARGGLGPYFTTTDALLTQARDVLALAATAGEKSAEAAALLCVWLPADRLYTVIEEAGDLGWHSVVAALLDNAEQAAIEGEYGPIWALRDAAIDLGDLPLAIAAQSVTAARRVDAPIEWIILARLEATNGAFVRAEALLERAVLLDSASAAEPLGLLRAAPERIAVSAGFGSDARRLRRRLLTRVPPVAKLRP